RVGSLGENDVRFADRLEQRDEHRRRATAGHLERRRLRRRERGAPLAHLGERQPAAVGGDVTPGSGTTGPRVRGSGDALLPAPGAHRVSVRCARDRQGGSMDWNFGTVFESVADAIPEHRALVQGDRRRTWREFDERAARLAAALRDQGVGPGSKIAFYLYNSNEYLETLFACFKLRAVPANVNYRYPADEL